MRVDRFDRFLMRAGNSDDLVPEFFDERLKVERDEGLIFDDEDIGTDLVGNFLAGRLDQSESFIPRAI